MKVLLKFLLILFIASSVAHEQGKTRWIEIGEATYELGLSFPYKVKLFVPFGKRNIAEMREGLIPLKIELDWLLIKLPKEEVGQLFHNQLQQSYKNEESFRLSKNLIYLFTRKMPEITKHDKWYFIYYPDLGTQLMIGDKKIYHLVGSEINRALLDSWINKNPMLTNSLFQRLLELQ